MLRSDSGDDDLDDAAADDFAGVHGNHAAQLGLDEQGAGLGIDADALAGD